MRSETLMRSSAQVAGGGYMHKPRIVLVNQACRSRWTIWPILS